MDEKLTDFYNSEWFIEGHQITPQMSVAEINQVLIDLRRIWNKRENFTPEKARRALSVLDEARIAFQTEQSKRRYDQQLAQQKQSKPAPVDYSPQRRDSGNTDESQFIDYYRSELGITRTMSSSAIISRLEKIRIELQSRGAFGQAFYAKMHLIQSAEYDFRDEAAKRAYDSEWDRRNSKAPEKDPDEDRKRTLVNNYKRALSFYNDGLKGEARVTAENALGIYRPDVDGPALFILLSNIAKDEGNIDKAISYVERAISSSYEDPYPYAQASHLYSFKEGTGDAEKSRLYAKKAISYAQAKNDPWFISVSYGLLAWSLCFREPKDMSQAIQLAKKAQSCYSGGDPWGNAGKVLQVKPAQPTQPAPVSQPISTRTVHKSQSVMSKLGMFWFLTLAIAIGIQAFVWLIWGDQLINALFDSSSSSSEGFLRGIAAWIDKLAYNIGPWGFIICSLIAQIVYNAKVSNNNDEVEWYHYVLSVLISIGGSLAWLLLIIATQIVIIIVVPIIVILIIIAIASGS